MAKNRNNNNQPQQPQEPEVKILASPLYHQTVGQYEKRNPSILNNLADFLDFKRATPTAAYGGKDYAFAGNGPLAGYAHAGLTRDISIVYTISGKNPNIIRLYGVFSHKELGTGTPAKPAMIRKNAGQFDRQTFSPLSQLDENGKLIVFYPLLSSL